MMVTMVASKDSDCSGGGNNGDDGVSLTIGPTVILIMVASKSLAVLLVIYRSPDLGDTMVASGASNNGCEGGGGDNNNGGGR